MSNIEILGVVLLALIVITIGGFAMKSRKRKEFMQQIINRLKEANKFDDTIDKKRNKLSETDTQVLLVEPVLSLAGYNIMNPYIIKRASRSRSANEFDIEVSVNGSLKIAIEVKSLSSKEYNVNNRMAGRLFRCRNASNKYSNRNGDGVGQLRAYCLNFPHFKKNKTVAVLTNGEEWTIFNNDFTDNPCFSIQSNQMVKAKISDEGKFEKIILKRLK